VRLSLLYYPEIWDAYQSLVFETVVNGPHQEPEGPQILESMKKNNKFDDKLPRPKTTGTVPVLMFKVLDKVTLVAKDHEFFRAGIQIYLFPEIKFCSSPERAVCRKILFLLKYNNNMYGIQPVFRIRIRNDFDLMDPEHPYPGARKLKTLTN
jgi:hypothetical protein